MKGKIVAITGASSGIGRGAALAFAKEGCKVAICARTQSRIDQTVKDIEALGPQAYGQSVDVADVSQMQSFLDNVVKRFGPIDVWVNNAGANHPRSVLEHTAEEFDIFINQNLRSVFFGGQFAMRHMIDAGVKGVILNMSSFTMKIPVGGQSLYAATKSAIISLTKSFEAECAPHGIRCVAIAPGIIETEMAEQALKNLDTKMLLNDIAERRFSTIEEIGRLMVILASPVSDYVAGVALECDGGKLCVQKPGVCWPNPL